MRSSTPSQLAFPITLLITAAVAFLPAAWQVGWTSELRRVVVIPLRPFTEAGVVLGGWLRPAPAVADVADVDRGDLDRLVEDRDRLERLYRAEQQRTGELEERLSQLQQFPPEMLRFSKPIIGHVTVRNPRSITAPVEVRLDRGADDEVPPGSPVVYAGVYLLGRTLGEPRGPWCTVLPIADPATGVIGARIFPRGRPDLAYAESPFVSIEPTGAGRLAGDVDAAFVIEAGDVVRLDDPAWPRAQMMVIGRVESIRVKDEEPLRNRITVRPVYRVGEVAYVTLIVERQAVAGEASGEQGGREP